MIYDVAIVGAGIAGASLAAQLDPSLSVILLEAEDRPGFHATGRSAAFYTETYGGAEVQPLTSASKQWYFTQRSSTTGALMVKPRGALHVNWAGPASRSERLYQSLRELAPKLRVETSEACAEHCAILSEEHVINGVYDPDCCDVDVANVHHQFLRQAGQHGVALECDFSLISGKRGSGLWTLTSARNKEVKAKTVVNAAGAWADVVAKALGARPLGFEPKRRTVAIFELVDCDPDPSWPLVLDIDDRFYFKPEGKQLLISPADETPSAPCDAQPEVEDIALAAHRFETMTQQKLGACSAKWAGLRTFSPDRSPVFGFDETVPDFFWCAGQGGFGIQTAPAAGLLSASLLQGDMLPRSLTNCGITVDRYAPQRFLKAA